MEANDLEMLLIDVHEVIFFSFLLLDGESLNDKSQNLISIDVTARFEFGEN